MRVRSVFAGLLLTLVMGASLALAWGSVHTYLEFGTIATDGLPPRVDYCGRRYYPSNSPTTQTLVEVNDFLSQNRRQGLIRIGTAPSGMPIVANVMSPQERAYHQTAVCTMALWVQTGPDAYFGYSLSGGP